MKTPSDNKNNNLWKDTDKDLSVVPDKSSDELKSTLEELHAHQIELELQNEELRRAQWELSEVRNQYADLYDLAPVGYVVLDLQYLISDANLTICKMLGITRLSLYKNGIFDFMSSKSKDKLYLLMHQILDTRSRQTGEVKMFKKGGGEFYASLECIPQEDSEGNISKIRIAVIDITKRVNAEKTLEKLEEKHMNLIQSVPDVLYSALPNEQGTILFISDKWKDWTGYSPEDCYKDSEVWAKSIHPEDKDRAVKTYVDAIINKKENFSEYRLVNKDNGQVRWVFDHGLPTIDEKGNVIRYDGSVTDITYRKKMEESINAEKIFSNSVIQSVPGLFYVFDKENARFLQRNENWVTVTGYSNEELDSMTALDFVVDRELCAQRMQEVFDSGSSTMEALLLTKIGEQIPYYFTGSRLILEGKTYLAGVAVDIAERKKAEKALKSSEKNLQITLNSIGDAFIATDNFGIITRMNPVAVKLTGWSSEEAEGLALSKVFKIFNAKTGKAAENPIEKVLTGGKAVGLANHTMLIAKDGAEYQIGDSAAPIIDDNGKILGVVLIFSDVTEEYRIREALEKRVIALTHPIDDINEVLFGNLFNLDEIQLIQDQFAEATGVASIISNPNGVPITKPSNFSRLCRDIIRPTDIGCKNCQNSDKILGKPNPKGPVVQLCMSGGLWDAGASIMIGGKHIATWLVGQVRNEKQSEEKILLYADEIGADKEEFLKAYREVTVMPEKQFNKIAQALFTLANQLSKIAYQNVQQARFIEERKDATEKLEIKTNELEHSNRNLEQFAYVASHDLQEPLRVIISSLGIIKMHQKDKMDEKSQKFFNFAVDGASRMKQLISALLEVSRIRSDEVSFKSIDMNKIINKVLLELKKNISNSNTQIFNHPLSNVWGNEELIITLFRNIILNGIKYQKNNKPIIDISCKEYRSEVEFCISDNGIGIDKKDYERIFAIFKRLHPRTEYSGSGMGLTACKNIVEVHGGKIWVESEIGKGSKFYFTLKKENYRHEL